MSECEIMHRFRIRRQGAGDCEIPSDMLYCS